MKHWLKSVVRNALSSRGYVIGKAPIAPFSQLSLFELAVFALTALRGKQLRFVQVGANDGVYGDVISPHALRGEWSGILIEPQPEVFERLKRNYAKAADRMIFENVAIGRDGRASLTLFRPAAVSDSGDYGSSIASFRSAGVADQANVAEGHLERVVVECVTLDRVLAKHSWQDVDLLLVDTEGLDLEVLQSLSLAAHRPGVIQFEHGHLTPTEIASAVNYLSSNGYKLYFGGRYTDTIAIDGDLMALVSQSISNQTVFPSSSSSLRKGN